MSVMLDITYEISTYRRGKNVLYTQRKEKNALLSSALIFSTPQEIQMHHLFFPKTLPFCYSH